MINPKDGHGITCMNDYVHVVCFSNMITVCVTLLAKSRHML